MRMQIFYFFSGFDASVEMVGKIMSIAFVVVVLALLAILSIGQLQRTRVIDAPHWFVRLSHLVRADDSFFTKLLSYLTNVEFGEMLKSNNVQKQETKKIPAETVGSCRRLTHRQMEYFDFIVSFEQEHKYPPKIEEIQKHFGLNSPSSVHQKLTELESEGVIRRQKNTHRGIEIIGWPSESEMPAPVWVNQGKGELQIPILGMIAAGSPFVPSEDPIGFLSVSSELALSNHFALRVSGESMKDDQIADGDFIVVKEAKGNHPRNGKTVVALIDNNKATVKRFYDEGTQIRLQPANDTMAPIIITPPNRVKIQGIVVGLVRKFK